MDVWVTQIGTGQFYNRTADAPRELVNAAIRTVGFSPDGSLVTFWVRHTDLAGTARIDVWAAPVLGGVPKPYLEGAAEYDWSRDAMQLVYHTRRTAIRCSSGAPPRTPPGRALLTAPDTQHRHFTTWSPDGRWIYFLQGMPGRMDVWRVPVAGGSPERVTQHDSAVTHPVFLDERTLLYLATDPDGSGAAHLRPRRRGAAAAAPDGRSGQLHSLSASADGSRLVATVSRPTGTLWRLPIGGGVAGADRAQRIALTTGNGSSPRLGPGFLLYVSSKGAGDGIWKVQDGASAEVWSAPEARVIGGPTLAPDGQRMVFSTRRTARCGSMSPTRTAPVRVRCLPRSNLKATRRGRSTARRCWSPRPDSTAQLFRVALETGAVSPLVREYSSDPRRVSGRPPGRLFGRGCWHDVPAESRDPEGQAAPLLPVT
jgi:hypothetical protein